MQPILERHERFEELRRSRGLTTEQLAQATGLSKSALNNYEKDPTKDINHFSLIKLSQYYGVSIDYLLGLQENLLYPHVELSELHINDDMVELLKSGRINNRLLCEIASHKEFANLMADIELFVDRLAAMQIHNLNVWVDAAREEIIAKHQPSETDRTMRTLNSAHIIEDTYFSELIHNDIDAIVKDIRDSHSKDSTSAPVQPELADIRKQLQEVADYEGNDIQKLVMIFCQQTKLNYARLTEEEKHWLVKIANKSTLLRSGSNQRGRKKNTR